MRHLLQAVDNHVELVEVSKVGKLRFVRFIVFLVVEFSKCKVVSLQTFVSEEFWTWGDISVFADFVWGQRFNFNVLKTGGIAGGF